MSAAALTEVVELAERSFLTADPDGFQEAIDSLTLDLPCLREVVDPTLAPRVHGVLGVSLVLRGEQEHGLWALAANTTEHSPLLDGLPQAHPLAVARNNAQALEQAALPLPPPLNGTALLDGVPALTRDSQRAALLQVTAEDGSIQLTQVLFPDQTPPYETQAPPAPVEAPVAVAPVAEQAPLPEPVRPGPRRLGWSLAAGGAAVGALALWGASAASWQAFWDEQTPRTREELTALQNQSNVLSGAAIGVGVLAAGATVTLAATW